MVRQSWLTERSAKILCAILLCIMAFNLVSTITRKSVTIDELVLTPAGYYHLVAGQFNLVPDHPPFCKILAAIPLLFIQPNEFDASDIEPGVTAGDRAWACQMKFWTDNAKDFERISFWTRLPMIAVTLGLGVLIFVFARRLFGSSAALAAVALFTFEPTVLGHGRIVHTDIPAAFGFLLLFYMMSRYVAEPTGQRAMWIGVAAGVALLTKFSMLLCGPILCVFFAVRFWRGRPAVLKHALAITLTIILIVNAGYFFKHRALEQPERESLQKWFGPASAVIVPSIQGMSHVLPAEFILGIVQQLQHSSEGHPASLLGMYRKTGWWYYFPVAFALKTTLPFLLLSLAALVWGCWRMLTKRDRRFLWLVLPFIVYTVFLFFSGINIGVRYYLPGFTFLFIMAGALLASLTKSRRFRMVGLAVVALVLGWCAVITVRAYPDYIPYMNALASPHPHWWYLSDSNVEWGDDIGGLMKYLRARGETHVRAAMLGGFLTPQLYGCTYLDMLSDNPLPDTRYVAIGASFLNGSTVPERPDRTDEQRVNRFDAFRGRVPDAMIGGSIYVYRMHD
jgi:hypothetical protein